MKNIEYKPFGRIKVKLDEYMIKNDISTYALAKSANVEFKTIQNLRENAVRRIDFEVLAKICYVLELDVKDIIEYEKV